MKQVLTAGDFLRIIGIRLKFGCWCNDLLEAKFLYFEHQQRRKVFAKTYASFRNNWFYKPRSWHIDQYLFADIKNDGAEYRG